MNAIEKRIAELERYMPDLTGSDDLEPFWERTLQAAERKALRAERKRAETPFPYADAYRVTYEGYDDTPIHGWYLVPKFVRSESLPCVVSFHGYSGGKGYPEEYAAWLLLGMAVFAVDVRGQGGETGNRLDQGYGMAKGWITQGILDHETCYYKAIAIDAVKALDWVWEQPEVDRNNIVVHGDSQGGGLALLVSALSSKPGLAVANIPNMCHMDFGMLNSTGSLTEAAAFAERFPEHLDRVLKTLSYFDMMNLAHRIRIPVMVSVGLKDTVCLPETVYAAYNRIASPKSIHVYPFTGHMVVRYHNRKMYESVKRFITGEEEKG